MHPPAQFVILHFLKHDKDTAIHKLQGEKQVLQQQKHELNQRTLQPVKLTTDDASSSHREHQESPYQKRRPAQVRRPSRQRVGQAGAGRAQIEPSQHPSDGESTAAPSRPSAVGASEFPSTIVEGRSRDQRARELAPRQAQAKSKMPLAPHDRAQGRAPETAMLNLMSGSDQKLRSPHGSEGSSASGSNSSKRTGSQAGSHIDSVTSVHRRANDRLAAREASRERRRQEASEQASKARDEIDDITERIGDVEAEEAEQAADGRRVQWGWSSEQHGPPSSRSSSSSNRGNARGLIRPSPVRPQPVRPSCSPSGPQPASSTSSTERDSLTSDGILPPLAWVGFRMPTEHQASLQC